ncbi:TetR/AcrR family transcriptional regulator [Kutzneria viridogrisea]|uniref:AcrR family transcriptional regulator n=1 Tax=Kutzneria viridogrisea TaxID=47990 RepID=A0ABR6BUT3_9PSEU|nr:TetR/AcrR family transcriptional regulator [Kutzneria albida]MBA8930309.1 AcrR family transcriptional regulator [Kutzneria viridogrisea]
MTEGDPTASGKPLRADARRNRARVLAVAQDVFEEEGLAVPIDEIARRAGVGVGTVYRHFPTKESLFEAIVVDRLQRIGSQARELAGAEDPGAAFFEFFARMVRDATLNRALSDALAATTDFDELATTEASRSMMEGLGELLRQAQRSGAVRPDIGVAEVKALIVGCLSMRRHSADQPELVVSVVCDGMRA